MESLGIVMIVIGAVLAAYGYAAFLAWAGDLGVEGFIKLSAALTFIGLCAGLIAGGVALQ